MIRRIRRQFYSHNQEVMLCHAKAKISINAETADGKGDISSKGFPEMSNITKPKSQCSIRDIPIPEVLLPYLDSKRSTDEYVLTGRSDIYVEPRTMQNHFKRILKQCDIEDVNFHVLRHTFATRCIELGFDIKSLSEILGHANVNITLNRYVHPSMDLKQQNMSKLSDLFAVK